MISRIIVECLEGKRTVAKEVRLSKFAYQENLLSLMETFNRRFSGEEWEKVKEWIASEFLLTKARQWKTSKSWVKRNYSARCFALLPLVDDEDAILVLMDDPVFLVRNFAAIAAIRLESKQGLDKIIQHMSNEKGYARFFYRDILLNSKSLKIFNWIEEYAAYEREGEIHLTCLDLLAGINMPIDSHFLRGDLKSSKLSIRVAALKVFSNNPQIDSAEVLSKYINDPNEEIREQAVHGLGFVLSETTLEKLRQALNDPSWKVRFEAAKALKEMGRAGKAVLQRQTIDQGKEAYETAQYVLQFDW